MAISNIYVVSTTGSRIIKTTRKRQAIRAAHRMARRYPGQQVNVLTGAGELIYQCHAQREGRRWIHIVTEEL